MDGIDHDTETVNNCDAVDCTVPIRDKTHTGAAKWNRKDKIRGVQQPVRTPRATSTLHGDLLVLKPLEQLSGSRSFMRQDPIPDGAIRFRRMRSIRGGI